MDSSVDHIKSQGHNIFVTKRFSWQSVFVWTTLGIGWLVFLVAAMLYIDVFFKETLKDNSSTVHVLNKTIDFSNTMGKSSAFSKEELEEIQNAIGVKGYVPFETNHFQVSFYTTGILALSTELYLEALPKEVIDYKGDDFKWNEGDGFVPIIVSEDLLSMYNFGFALSQGFPQLSESSIKSFRGNLRIKGPNGQKTFTAGLVGLSKKISGILAPEPFLKWANQNYGSKKASEVNKLLILEGVESADFQSLIVEKEWSLNGAMQSDLKHVITSLAIVLGIIAVLILSLTYLNFWNQFLTQLYAQERHILIFYELGFSPKRIYDIWQPIGLKRLCLLFLFLSVIFMVSLWGIKAYTPLVLGFDDWPVLACSLGVCLLSLLLTYVLLRRALLKALNKLYF